MRQRLLFLLALCAGQLCAQTVISKTYGPGGNMQSQPYYMAMAPDSGYFMAGGKGNPNAPGDALLIRVNKNGDTLWTAGFGTTMGDGLIGVTANPDGSSTVVGTVNMPFIQQSTPRLMIARFSTNGQMLWAKSYSPLGYSSYADGIIALPDHGFLLLGSQLVASQFGFDAFACRVDSLGNLVWSNVYRMSSGADETFNRGRLLPDGSFILAGTISGSALLCKMDGSGNVTWARRVSSASSTFSGTDVAVTPGGGFVMMGGCTTGQSLEMYAMGFDALGDTTWTSHYGSPVNSEWGYSICPSQNGFMLCGSTESFSGSIDAWLTEIDTLGQVIWSRAYGDGNWQEGGTVLPSPEGGYTVAAREQGQPGAYRFWFFKTDSAGVSGLCSEYAAATITGFQPASITTPFLNVVQIGQATAESFTSWRGVPVYSNCILTTVEEENSPAWNIFPNPAQDELTISSANAFSNATVRVFDAQGKMVLQLAEVSGNIFSLNTNGLADGIYFAMIADSSGTITSKKLVIAR